MDHFIVSARKYRPQTFKDVVGQQSITNTLENAIANNHLAQALLFCGPRGVGKTSCARILAKRINQDDHTQADEDFAFNIFELDAASNNSVDDIRALIDQVRIPPQVGHYKVYIIDEVHMLSQAAFNAFLKTLEEPPKHAIFILATTEKHKIIPTILSRCQIFDFKRITISDARKHLMQIAQEEGIEAEEEALHIIAQKADGAMRDALSIFDRVVSFSGKTLSRKAVTENLNVLDYDTYLKITSFLVNQLIPDALLALDDILSRGFDGHHFIAGLASHFRDLMVCKNPNTINLLEVGNDTKKKYYDQSQQLEEAFLLKALELANTCDLQYKTSRNQRLLVELCLMQISSITLNGEKKNEQPFIVGPEQVKSSEVAHSPKSEPTEGFPKIEEAPISIQEEEPRPKPELSTTNKHSQQTYTNTEVLVDSKPSISLIDKRKTTGVSGLSLKSLQKKKEIAEKQAAILTNHEQLPTEAFTQESLQQVWQQYIAQRIAKGEKIIASVLEADIPKLEGAIIHLTYPNETMKVELERNQGKLLAYLRNQLNNHDIQLDITVNEEEQRKYAYTPQEKYEKLKEQNPQLDLLKKTFDLEL